MLRIESEQKQNSALPELAEDNPSAVKLQKVSPFGQKRSCGISVNITSVRGQKERLLKTREAASVLVPLISACGEPTV